MLMNDSQVQTLVEALPYLSKFKNKTIVVKYGGNAMLNDDLKNKVLQDIVFLQCAGMRPVVVHGGGPEITCMLMHTCEAVKYGTFTDIGISCKNNCWNRLIHKWPPYMVL